MSEGLNAIGSDSGAEKEGDGDGEGRAMFS